MCAVLAFAASTSDSRSSKWVDEALDRAVVDPGHTTSTLLAFWRQRGGQVRVDSVVRSRGETERRGAPVQITLLDTEWGSLEILAPSEDLDLVRDALNIGEPIEQRWLDATASSIGELLKMAKPHGVDSVHLKVIAVPAGAAYEHTETSSTAANPFTMAVMIAVDPNSGKQAPDWYARIVGVAAHEFLHLALFVNDAKPPNEFNEEAAASLYEFCATVLFARAVNADLGIDVSLADSDDYLSSSTPPTFAPNRQSLEKGVPTRVGDHMAHAILIAEMGSQFQSEDPKVDGILLPSCSAFGRGRIPDFIAGSTLSDPHPGN